MKTINDLNLSGQKVLIRADLNVPLNESLEVSDDNRIKQFLPTLKLVIEKGGLPIVMSHFGSPKNGREDSLSLKPVAKKMGELLKNTTILLANDCVGEEVSQMANSLSAGQVLLLENLRFNSGETSNSHDFAAQLAKLGNIYIGDAFATAHRAHASMVALPKLIKERAVGLLMQKELDSFEKAFNKPKRPLCIVLGGAKVSSKLATLVNISERADKIIIGGAMANTFLAAQGFQMGRSLYEPDLYAKCLELLGKWARRDCKVYLPVDLRVADSPKSKAGSKIVTTQEVPADTMALDIGPATSILYQTAVRDCETIVWNGPMGLFEQEEFSQGTTDMVNALATAHGFTVAGGGDTDAAIHAMELEHKFDFVSTGGGAFLALMEGQTLPGVAAIE